VLPHRKPESEWFRLFHHMLYIANMDDDDLHNLEGLSLAGRLVHLTSRGVEVPCAARMCNISPAYAWEILGRPAVREMIRRLRAGRQSR
jgi:hypothetical protein